MPASRTAKKKTPKILVDRRKLGYTKDKIWTRDWSNNKLGQAFVKDPEPMQKTRFYSTPKGSSPEEYKMHKLLEQKIRHLIKARPFRERGLVFFKGESGAFYVRLIGISSDKPIYIRVDNPSIKKAVEFLSK